MLLSVKWRKYHYTELINEFLAIFLLHLLYGKCSLNADLTNPAAASEAATSVCDNGPSGRLMNECMPSAPSVVFVLTFSTNLCKQFADKLTKTHRIRQ